jgi:hypothetical protein
VSDKIKAQVALSSIFNPALKESTVSNGKSQAPPTIMDVEDVRDFRMAFLRDENFNVKWIQMEVNLAGEAFNITCSACSSCGASFSGEFDDDPEKSWKWIENPKSIDNSRKRSGKDDQPIAKRLCIVCYGAHVSTGSLPCVGRDLVEKVAGMFPQGVVSVGASRVDSSPDFALKRKRVTTARWDPTEPSINERRPLSSQSRPSNLKGKPRSIDSGGIIGSTMSRYFFSDLSVFF